MPCCESYWEAGARESGNAAGWGEAALEKCCVTSYLSGWGSVPSPPWHPFHAAANELTSNPPPGQWGRGLAQGRDASVV